MLTEAAIKELAKATAIEAANKAITGVTTLGIVATEASFEIQDLEKYMPNRRHIRGSVVGSDMDGFASYVSAHAEHGARVFIDEESMSAEAILNLGDAKAPGHCDHRAYLNAKKTAAYKALQKIACGVGQTQAAVAEFMEDWAANIDQATIGDDDPVIVKHAIAAVRAINIESIKRRENQEQNLSASKSAFDSVKVTNDNFPSFIHFVCEPYAGLASRKFIVRFAVITGGDKPAITLRIVKAEEHQERMARELAALVTGAVGSKMPVVIGKFSST